MQHTAKQMMPAIGSMVAVRFDAFEVTMVVEDAKSQWGTVRLQVRPLAGEGLAWIDVSRVVRVIEQQSAGRAIVCA